MLSEDWNQAPAQNQTLDATETLDNMTTSNLPIVVGVFGESGVGKTSFLSKFMKGDTEALGRNRSTSIVSMNASPMTKVLTVEGGEDVSETAHCCDAFVVMYSVDKKSSLEKAITICQRISNTPVLKTRPIVIVGNKTDLKGLDEGIRRSLVDTTLSCKHMTVSAKLNQRIKPVFQYLIDHASTPSSSSGMSYKVQEQKATPGRNRRFGLTGNNNSKLRRSNSLPCKKPDKLSVQVQQEIVSGRNQARTPKDLCAIRELNEEHDDHKSDKVSKERDNELEVFSPNEHFRSETSLSLSSNLHERRLSSVNSGYQSVPELQVGKIQVIKSISFSSVNLPTFDAPSNLEAEGNKTELFGSIDHRLSERCEPSALKVQRSISKTVTQLQPLRSLCDKSSNYNAQGNNSKTLKPAKKISSVNKHRSVCERPMDQQVQNRKCKESSSVEMRLPECKVLSGEGLGMETESRINIDRKLSIRDVILPSITQKLSPELSSKSFRRSSSILKVAQNKPDKKSLNCTKAPQHRVKKASFGDLKHPSVCEKLPSLEGQRNKPERFSSVDASYLSVCDTLKNIKARQNKNERFSVHGLTHDATSDLRISGNTNVCYLTPAKETFQRDRTRLLEKTVQVRRSKLRQAIRPRVNCHVPLSDSQIRSLRRHDKACSVM